MANRNHVHYEQAFSQYLSEHRVPFVTVQQLARSADAVGKIKNFDFLVHAPSGEHYIVDVKGKRFPSASGKREVFWENWVHLDDLDGLVAWEEHFGRDYTGLLVFVYWLQADLPTGQAGLPTGQAGLPTGQAGLPTGQVGVPCPGKPKLHAYRDRQYLMVGITLNDFLKNCRRRSLRWQALYVPEKTFLNLIKPIETLMLNDKQVATSKRLLQYPLRRPEGEREG